MTAEWCAEVLQEAIQQYKKPEIFNTDQGSQFTLLKKVNKLFPVLPDNKI